MVRNNKKDVNDKKVKHGDEINSFYTEESVEYNFLEIKCDQFENIEKLRKFLKGIGAGESISISLNIVVDHQLDLALDGIAICVEPKRSVYVDFSRKTHNEDELLKEIKKFL